MGTVSWKISDDNGKEYELIIKCCLCVHDMSSYLLSPQHWVQQTNDNFPTNRGTWCATYDDACVMQWKQSKFTKTITYDKNKNTPRMSSVPRTSNFCANLQLCDKVGNTCEIAQTLAFCATSANEQLQTQSDVNPTKISQAALQIALSLTLAKEKLQK